MKLSTVLKVFGMFALASSGKLLPEAKADFIPNVTICNNFPPSSNIPVLFGDLAEPPLLEPGACEVFSTDENCRPLTYERKLCRIAVNNKWGNSGIGFLNIFSTNNATTEEAQFKTDGCIVPKGDNTYSIVPPFNFTCP